MTSDDDNKPIKVAVVGGGCASIAAAFELSRPEHAGKYEVTVYQLGWRLGGKGASGRGAADRIEEHGLHVWLGFYENAFRLMRECYAELGRDPSVCPIADWRDAFFPDPCVGMADVGRDGRWLQWTAMFPSARGLPGDSLSEHNPFTIMGYVSRTIALLKTLLTGVTTHRDADTASPDVAVEVPSGGARLSAREVSSIVNRLLKIVALGATAGIIEALAVAEVLIRTGSKDSSNTVVKLLQEIARSVRDSLERLFDENDEVRYKWEIIDLVIAILVGIIREGLIADPRGFDAIDDQECRQWLLDNGASPKSVDSAFVRGLFDLAMAYPGGDFERPALAAGQAIRGSLRMFFTYRGAMFWKMRAGMGDVVFAPFYEVLKKRGVRFEFFHRLENVRLSAPRELVPGDGPHVTALEFDVQATTKNGDEYDPLVDVDGLPCWPARPDYDQLLGGDRIEAEGWRFESFWDRNRVAGKTLRVGEDFDFVVLGVGIGAIPHVCSELVDRDERWRAMVEHVKTVPSQAFQIWLREDLETLGWPDPPPTISAFAKPFDTWSDMTHLVEQESWTAKPGAIAYFCSALGDGVDTSRRADDGYPRRREREVRANAVRFLEENIKHLWPNAVDGDGRFRWELLMDPADPLRQRHGAEAFDSQFWTANVDPSDRYTLAPPGSIKYRISPLDNTYDNLTIAGDWTACGFNEGCVEAAIMSGRLAAHALSKRPALAAIIGYDHP